MPNLVTNTLVITDPSGNIKKMIAEWETMKPNDSEDREKHEVKFSFDHHRPMPDNLAGNEKINWRLNNWGTKWDCFSVYQTFLSDTTLRLRFDTANDGACRAIEYMAEEHPDLLIGYVFDEPDTDTYFAGLIHGDHTLVLAGEDEESAYRPVRDALNSENPEQALEELFGDHFPEFGQLRR